MLNRKDYKDKLPYGYIKKVAEKAGVTPKAVSEFLSGKYDSNRIELAVLEVLSELSQKKQALLAQIV